jgi:hypothetical protein
MRPSRDIVVDRGFHTLADVLLSLVVYCLLYGLLFVGAG